MSEMIKIPVGWESTELGSSLEFIRNGYSGHQKNYLTNFPVTRIETISNGYIDFDKVGYVSNISADYALINGDILLSNINSVKHIGKIALYNSTRVLYHGMNLLLLRFKEDRNSSFMYYYLITKKSWFENNCSVAINQASINQSRIKELELIIPKLEQEQQKIAEVLSEVDNAISKTEELFEKNKRLKTALMQDLLSYGVDEKGKIRNPQTHKFKPSELGAISEEWDTVKLGNSKLFTLKTGGTPSTTKKEYWDNGNILWMSSGEVNNKIITDTELKITELGYKSSSATMIPKFSILMALAGQGKTRGMVAINHVELSTNQSVAAIICNDEEVSSQFLFYYLDSQYENLRNISYGAGRAGLSLTILREIEIIFPPKTEQQKIAQILSSQDEKIEEIKNKLNKLKSLKASLMQDLLSGKVRVTKLMMEENS